MGYAGLIIALGNPGRRYALTRHNCGFLLADVLLGQGAFVREISGAKKALLWEWRPEADAACWLILKPQTFMNRSGEGLRPLQRRFGFDPAQILVAHDELDLPFGTLRFKTGGGLAGHKGLKSLVEVLGSRDFHRIRIGIGRPDDGSSVTDYVLERFSRPQMSALPEVLTRAAQVVEGFCMAGPEEALNLQRSLDQPGTGDNREGMD